VNAAALALAPGQLLAKCPGALHLTCVSRLSVVRALEDGNAQHTTPAAWGAIANPRGAAPCGGMGGAPGQLLAKCPGCPHLKHVTPGRGCALKGCALNGGALAACVGQWMGRWSRLRQW